ncbi:MAG: tetratricopeptide repeat protein [Candidatus Omnitrophota bacterium]|jgi:tetratricopeptide (TPR) repeat protein
MKKTIILFLLILITVFAVLTFLDKGEYAMEKQLWWTQKQYEQIARDPKAVPDQNYEDLVSQYRKIIRKFPNAKLTRKIYIKIGKIYLLKKDYVKARAGFQEAITRYSEDPVLQSEALMHIGNSFEIEAQYNEAQKVYRQIIEKYASTDIGMSMPMYLITLNSKIGRPADAEKASAEALVFYDTIAKKNPETKNAFAAQRMLAAVHFARGNTQKGLNVLGQMLSRYADSPLMTPQQIVLIVKTINTMSVANMKDYDTPIAIYQDFLNQNPRHQYSMYLQKTINGLKELKEKNIGIRFQAVPQSQNAQE